MKLCIWIIYNKKKPTHKNIGDKGKKRKDRQKSQNANQDNRAYKRQYLEKSNWQNNKNNVKFHKIQKHATKKCFGFDNKSKQLFMA